jgi:hypothetical protein
MDQANKLVSAEKLRMYFDPPLSLRTIRTWQAARVIPYIRIGRRIFFDPVRVLDHLRARNMIQPR